jgi:hypothetical protein
MPKKYKLPKAVANFHVANEKIIAVDMVQFARKKLQGLPLTGSGIIVELILSGS